MWAHPPRLGSHASERSDARNNGVRGGWGASFGVARTGRSTSRPSRGESAVPRTQRRFRSLMDERERREQPMERGHRAQWASGEPPAKPCGLKRARLTTHGNFLNMRMTTRAAHAPRNLKTSLLRVPVPLEIPYELR